MNETPTVTSPHPSQSAATKMPPSADELRAGLSTILAGGADPPVKKGAKAADPFAEPNEWEETQRRLRREERRQEPQQQQQQAKSGSRSTSGARTMTAVCFLISFACNRFLVSKVAVEASSCSNTFSTS